MASAACSAVVPAFGAPAITNCGSRSAGHLGVLLSGVRAGAYRVNSDRHGRHYVRAPPPAARRLDPSRCTSTWAARVLVARAVADPRPTSSSHSCPRNPMLSPACTCPRLPRPPPDDPAVPPAPTGRRPPSRRPWPPPPTTGSTSSSTARPAGGPIWSSRTTPPRRSTRPAPPNSPRPRSGCCRGCPTRARRCTTTAASPAPSPSSAARSTERVVAAARHGRRSEQTAGELTGGRVRHFGPHYVHQVTNEGGEPASACTSTRPALLRDEHLQRRWRASCCTPAPSGRGWTGERSDARAGPTGARSIDELLADARAGSPA